MEEGAQIAQEMREEYALATAEAAAQLRRRGWEEVWCRVARKAAMDLLQPDADRFAILRRLERLVDWFRRTTTDPVRLFASLRVQEAVEQTCVCPLGQRPAAGCGTARLERWCEESAVGGSESHPSPGSGLSTAFQALLAQPSACV